LCPYCFSVGEVQIMPGNIQLFIGYLELKQTRINIYKGSTSEAGKQRRIDFVMEV